MILKGEKKMKKVKFYFIYVRLIFNNVYKVVYVLEI